MTEPKEHTMAWDKAPLDSGRNGKMSNKVVRGGGMIFIQNLQLCCQSKSPRWLHRAALKRTGMKSALFQFFFSWLLGEVSRDRAVFTFLQLCPKHLTKTTEGSGASSWHTVSESTVHHSVEGMAAFTMAEAVHSHHDGPGNREARTRGQPLTPKACPGG